MKVFRWLAAGLLWILAGVVGLVGGLLCITIILLPIGLPLLWLARKLGGTAGRLMLPKAARHPVQAVRSHASDVAGDTNKGARRWLKKGGKAVAEATPSSKKTKKVRKRARRKLERVARG